MGSILKAHPVSSVRSVEQDPRALQGRLEPMAEMEMTDRREGKVDKEYPDKQALTGPG